MENGKKRVALTFDDGPHPENTQKIIKLLEKYDAKATFFQIGKLVDTNPAITLEVFAKGHEIASHTWNHPDLITLNEKEVEEEISTTQSVIKTVIGELPTHFRPPYGNTNESIKEIARGYGEKEVLWTVDTLDWKSRDPEAILKIVTEEVRDNSIILMHDIHSTTVEAVELVLKYLHDEGYEMVTLRDL
ncbi:polysaccharide deacetylase family protein [Bacillus sp. FJAT-49732]|uniref:Polysaccharide deacetylase family protein n=1 Tax=Lederbergia citrisecunda TaxID=2833583 RepID=A0A942TPI9_9BACI|nr:polysaccharide deacetylase family protein [Lederbergia citrisecunda]MBS4200521.1 polysaccharide deacetylase family protein [Lederbergia citrisecunda]